jgi:23S rRNA-/tRNA-specific pseudouridylate synthase
MYRVIYENKNVLIIDKLVPVPTLRQGSNGGLSDDVLLEFPYLSSIPDCGFTHRLDNETLGLILIAKDDNYYAKIRHLFSEKKINKLYLARVRGVLVSDKGIIDTPIAHSAKSTKKMIAVKEGYRIFRGNPRAAVTEWKVINKRADSTDLELSARTGVRHQIRVHLASIDHPICGDRLYGKSLDDYPSLMLISKSLNFICPESGEKIEAVSTLTLDSMFGYIR